VVELLSKKQDLIWKIFSAIVGKQELGKVGAKEVDQIMAIAEAAADKIIKAK